MIEVVTGVRRRCDWSDEEKLPFMPHDWSDEEKLPFMPQTNDSGASVSVVAPQLPP